MATWAKVGDGSLVLSGEAVYPFVFAETFHSETLACLGHAGGKCLWEQMLLTTECAQEEEGRRFTMCVSRQCETFQACVRPPRLHTRFSHTPIPARSMVSFDSLAVCVDRHSG